MNDFLQKIDNSLLEKKLVKLHLGNYKGSDKTLKKIIARPISLRGKIQFSLVFRHQTQDITKNFEAAEFLNLLEELLGPHQFRHARLFTTEGDTELMVSKKGQFKQKTLTATFKETQLLSHDIPKNRKITTTQRPYLHALGITSEKGEVYKKAQDKFKQINHYIELLSSLLERLPQKEVLNIVDMGAGKGYLTFALYDYLTNELGINARLVGVEYRQDLVIKCNNIAKDNGFEGLTFKQGSIVDFECENDIDILIALHACDTATDDAIYKGIKNKADLIVAAPCCHKQIRREMKQHQATYELGFMLQYGVFLERQAEMLTDSIRALLLNIAGYKTKAFEFVADAHTPKNVLIVGERFSFSDDKKDSFIKEYKKIKSHFGIDYHHLGRLMELE